MLVQVLRIVSVEEIESELQTFRPDLETSQLCDQGIALELELQLFHEVVVKCWLVWKPCHR